MLHPLTPLSLPPSPIAQFDQVSFIHHVPDVVPVPTEEESKLSVDPTMPW
jgi:hypothetical protein